MTNQESSRYSESRLEEIEAKLTLAEDLLDTLNRTVYRQQQHIDRLERELRALREQLEVSSASMEPNTPQEELPPHY